MPHALQLPKPFVDIPRDDLLFGFSPIQHLPRMSRDLSETVQIYAKREDCNSGLAYGGNKTRKLEYLISDAVANGASHLVSIGGVQSNHTRQVAALAAKYGLKAKLIQKTWAPWSEPGHDRVGNIQLSALMSAESIMDPSGFSVAETSEVSPGVKQIMDDIRADSGVPYWIPAGASDHPLGGLGFARWAFEVEEQEKQLGVFFDTVIVCAVTGSTFGGMIAGFKLLETMGSKTRKVLGIDASAEPQDTFKQVLKIARVTAAKIGLEEDAIAEEDVVLISGYAGPVYGVPDKQTYDAIRYGASIEAFITDPVYEGKSLAGMIDLIRKGAIKDSNVLYAHLGGQLALNAYTQMESRCTA